LKSGEKMNSEVSILLIGEAGQGIKTIEQLLVMILEKQKHFFFMSMEYMSRVRGGINSTQIVISDVPVNSARKKIDLFISLSDDAAGRYENRMDAGTVRAGSRAFLDIAGKNGDERYANSVVFGYLCAYIGSDTDAGADIIKEKYEKRPEIYEGSMNSFLEGYKLFSGKAASYKKTIVKHVSFDVSKAVAYGAVFGGCDFIAAYPMSPSTAVLSELARLGDGYGIIVEQAEDEIAAINMALGASYAGARSMVMTSGGGFALMEEGISLAGATETPVVVLLGQRPGPATGMPTRTEQGDFYLALHAGHGEFQRVIYAPGNQAQAIGITMDAFNTADRYQIPVIILADQHMLDSVQPVPVRDIPKPVIEKYTEKTEKRYKRYLLTQDGISKRGIPGYGEGRVRADSDEHDEDGRITEDLDMRVKMVVKRNARYGPLKEASLMPELIGDEGYKTLAVCFGSNLGIALDLKDKCAQFGCAFLHFSQLYPLNDQAMKYFIKAKKILAFENNYSGQFATYLEKRFDIKISKKILKYNGAPFYAEEVYDAVREAAI
jgi:2-oxoglutarate/2-oxoacid ferredoxin oxidoreductase subunit alpha